MLPALHVHVEQLDQNFEILRFAIQLVVKRRTEFQDGLRLRMLFAHACPFASRNSFCFLSAEHPPLQRSLKTSTALASFPAAAISIDKLEQPAKSLHSFRAAAFPALPARDPVAPRASARLQTFPTNATSFSVSENGSRMPPLRARRPARNFASAYNSATLRSCGAS